MPKKSEYKEALRLLSSSLAATWGCPAYPDGRHGGVIRAPKSFRKEFCGLKNPGKESYCKLDLGTIVAEECWTAYALWMVKNRTI